MISLTGGLAGATGGSYMRLIMAPFDLMPEWSGFVVISSSGGHSRGYLEDREELNYQKIFRFMCEIDGKTVEKTFKVKYPLSKIEIINIEIRPLKLNVK